MPSPNDSTNLNVGLRHILDMGLDSRNNPTKIMSKTTETTEEIKTPNNAFSNLLSQFRDGESLHELSDKLALLVEAVRSTGKPGKLSYTLILKPSGDAVVVTDDEVKLKIPTAPREAAIFFVTEEATLVRDNPNQRQLELREVKKPAPAELKEAKAPEAIAN